MAAADGANLRASILESLLSTLSFDHQTRVTAEDKLKLLETFEGIDNIYLSFGGKVPRIMLLQTKSTNHLFHIRPVLRGSPLFVIGIQIGL